MWMGVVVEIIPITSYSINLTVNFLPLQKGEGQLSYQEKGGGFYGPKRAEYQEMHVKVTLINGLRIINSFLGFVNF